jgi:FkbM family methyltransferase
VRIAPKQKGKRPVGAVIRDQARLRVPRALEFYHRWIRPPLTGERRHIELADWIDQGVTLVTKRGMVAIRIDREGPWIEDSSGFLWYYEGGLFGTGTWAEYGQEYERNETGLLAELLPPGGTLIDIGANVGLHSIKLARRRNDVRIVAFEPVGSSVECLRRNIRKNSVAEKIEVHQLALASHTGKVRITRGLQGTNFVLPSDAPAANRAVESVPCCRLDDLVEDRTGSVDLIKCDVEGSELGVMQGGIRTIQRLKPTIFVEIVERYSRRYGQDPDATFDYLRAHGYCHELIINGERRPSTGSLTQDLATTTNFLFVNRESKAAPSTSRP